MAKREFAISLNDTTLEWRRVGAPVDAPPVFKFDVDTVHEGRKRDAYVYGVRQILADGGALDKGASIGEKLAMMEKRANALRDGTWGTRQAPSISPEAAVAALRKAGFTVEQIAAMVAE